MMDNDQAFLAGLVIGTVCGAVLMIGIMSNCGYVDEKEWSQALRDCSKGVEKVYLDGDYDCKKVK